MALTSSATENLLSAYIRTLTTESANHFSTKDIQRSFTMECQRSKRQFATNFLQSLPPELSLYILSIVDVESLCAAAQTCKNWNNVIENTDYLWKLLCHLNCEDWTDVVEDRASGFSWKETLQRNFKHHAIRRKWMRGDFSCFQSYDDLPGRIMCIMDQHQWGQIFELELSR